MKKGKAILLVILLIAAFIGAKFLYDQVTAWQRGQIMDGPGMDPVQTLVDEYGITEDQALAVINGEVKLEDILNGMGKEETEPSSVPEPSSEPVPANEPDGGTDETAWDYSQFPKDYTFRSKSLLNEHYEKHGIEMGFESAEAYAESANLVIHHPDVLWKTEKDDGDYCFFLEETGEFVVLSTDGYIRTYFWPSSGKKYYDKQ